MLKRTQMDVLKPIGQIEVSFAFSRHMGPRNMHGAVTLQFDSLRSYSFTSNVRWPDGNNYDEPVRLAIEETLQEMQGHIKGPSVLLKGIEWDDVSSCQSAFVRAAKAATRAAFEV